MRPVRGTLRDLLDRLGSDERGAALVEMTLITPFLLLLCAGVFEFSNILYQRLLIEAGVEDAARYLARCSDTWTSCVAQAKNLAVNGTVTGGTPRVPGWSTSNISDPVVTGTAPSVVTVSTSFPYSGTGLWAYLGFGSLNITASHQERVIGW